MKIKKGDQIKIIAGKDKGKSGKVIHSFPAENKIVAEGLNLMKKNMRPKKEGEKGQIVQIPRKINISKVMLVCPKCEKDSRIGYKVTNENKFRICKKCKAEI